MMKDKKPKAMTKEQYQKVNNELLETMLQYDGQITNYDMLRLAIGLLDAIMNFVAISQKVPMKTVASFTNDLLAELHNNHNNKRREEGAIN